MPITHAELERIAIDCSAAWNSGSVESVASVYSADGRIVIDCGTSSEGRAGVAEMAAGFFADVPDLALTCDDVCVACDEAIFVWTFTGHDAATGHPLEVRGWEAWEIAADGKIAASAGWFDAEAHARQAAGN